jgi:hypothetical protein
MESCLSLISRDKPPRSCCSYLVGENLSYGIHSNQNLWKLYSPLNVFGVVVYP